MKLPEHVDKLRELIEAAFVKQFARLGIGKNKQLDIEKIPEEVRAKRIRLDEMLVNHIGETGDYEHAREKLIDELTFTLFNRLAAVKVMEAATLFPPVLTKQPEHGDRSFGHKAWLEMNPHMRSEELEGIREYLKYAFNELGETLPLYSKAYPYALLPDTISMNEIIDAFNAVEKDPLVGSDIWESDDVLGWLYESYNNKKKQAHKDSKDKTEYNKVSLQSQVYTPRWVVQFLVENSLGKLYLEMYQDSEIRRKYKIANAPQTQARKPKPLHEIKIIDPACGSGNFLLYAFDFLYALYIDQIENYGADYYDERDIPKLIIEKNLHGIDLDDRAVQLAQLGLFIKAKKKHRNIGKFIFNVVSSDFYLPEYGRIKQIFEKENTLTRTQREVVENIWSDLHFAYKFGSLIRLNEKMKSELKKLVEQRDGEQQQLFTNQELSIKPKPKQLDMFKEHLIEVENQFVDKFFRDLKTAVAQYAQAQVNTFLTSKTRDAITFLELLTTEYDVATTNPPYTDSADFGSELKEFIENNYRKPYKFNTNLYAAFIKRCYEMTSPVGKIAMIHPHTFMFIKTFEDVRKFIIDKCHIDAMVDYGLDRVNLFGPGILLDATFYVLSKADRYNEGLYFNLTTNLQEKFKKSKFLEALTDYIGDVSNDRVYVLAQSKLKIIKSWPFIYWISDEFREKFKFNNFEYYFKLATGLMTGNNLKHLRFYWEVALNDLSNDYLEDKKKWVPYQKGGVFNKWYGNNWLVVNFQDDGKSLATTDNKAFYFQDGITYSATSSKGVSFRELPPNQIFDKKGSCIFSLQGKKSWDLSYVLAVLNSKITFYVINCLNSTAETQIGDVKRIPFIEPEKNKEALVAKFAKINVEIKKHLNSYSLVEKEYSRSPLFNSKLPCDYRKSIFAFLNTENHLLTQVLINEAFINENIFEVYDLTKHDKAMILAKEGECIGGLPVLTDARESYLAEIEATKDFPLGAVRDFIQLLPTREFTAEEREEIESGFPSLYQNNNDLEEFCIRHQANPINVWYWFKQSNVIPQQRMHTLAMEFLADMIREILKEDEDGIVPLVSNAGKKVLLERIEEKFREKGFSLSQYSSFDTILGRPIHEYLNKYFFAELSEHLNMFPNLPKTPFIWHLFSGPEQGFDCYIIIYKWSRDKLMRLRSVYIEHRERSLVNRQSDLVGNESAEAQNEKYRIFRQLKEIETFKVKIDELLAEGYNPILDDGVGKNIAPLQNKKMIPYEVLNESQLKKYLNADW